MKYTLKVSTYVDGKLALAGSVVELDKAPDTSVAVPFEGSEPEGDDAKIEALGAIGMTDEEIADFDLDLVELKKDGTPTKASLKAIGWDG